MYTRSLHLYPKGSTGVEPLDLSSEVIEADICVIDAQRVE